MDMRAIEWFNTPFQFNSANGRLSLDHLKQRVPSCNCVGLNMNVTTRSATNISVVQEELDETDYAISYACTKGYKISVRLMCRGNINSRTWLSSFSDLCREIGVWLEERGVEYFCTGGEMLALEYPEYFDLWTQLIEGVREVYSGKVFYNTNWPHNQTLLDLKKNTVWYADTDVVAVSAYPNLFIPSEPEYSEPPNITEVYDRFRNWRGWGFRDQNIADVIKSIATHFNKPLIIYCGTSSYHSALFTPPATAKTAKDYRVNLEIQDLYIKGLFKFFSDIEGMHFDGSWLTHPNKDPNNWEFSLQRKPAEATVQSNFEALTPEPEYVTFEEFNALKDHFEGFKKKIVDWIGSYSQV